MGVQLEAVSALRGSKYKIVTQARRLLYPSKIAKLVKKNKVDIIYCSYELPILEAALKVRDRERSVKVIMRMAGMRWIDRKDSSEMFPRFVAAFKAVDSINYISEGVRELTAKAADESGCGPVDGNDRVLDIGSSAVVSRATSYDTLPKRPFRIVMAARFTDYQKRQDILIRAAALIPSTLPIEIELIGGGSELLAMKSLAIELGVQDRVKFVNFLDQASLWGRYEKAHIMCHAANYEGLGKVIVEAMAKGLPVLASDVKPMNKYINDGENGFLVSNTPEEWASRIVELYHARSLRCHVSSASMTFANQHFNADVQAKKYEAYFDEVSKS